MKSDLENQFKKDFRELCGGDATITFGFTRLEAWVLFAHVQLALRHPGNKGPSAEIARKVAERIQKRVATTGALAEIARRGWHQEFDI